MTKRVPLVHDDQSFCSYFCVKAPGLGDRKYRCINLIQLNLRSPNRGGFHAKTSTKNFGRPVLYFPFAIALFFCLFGTAFFPFLRLIPFAPFLALLYNRSTFLKSLWVAALCGFIVDLFSAHASFGLYGLNYTLTTVALYKQRRHFFEDKSIGICFFTALISAVSTLFQLILNTGFEQSLPLSWQRLATEMLCMPCIDALYAYLGFCCTMKAYIALRHFNFKAFIRRTLTSLRAVSKKVIKSG